MPDPVISQLNGLSIMDVILFFLLTQVVIVLLSYLGACVFLAWGNNYRSINQVVIAIILEVLMVIIIALISIESMSENMSALLILYILTGCTIAYGAYHGIEHQKQVHQEYEAGPENWTYEEYDEEPEGGPEGYYQLQTSFSPPSSPAIIADWIEPKNSSGTVVPIDRPG